MGDCADKIPIIDFSAYRLSLEKPDRSQFQKLVDDVHKALTTIGFFFIVNTDFQQEKVPDIYKTVCLGLGQWLPFLNLFLSHFRFFFHKRNIKTQIVFN